MPHISLDARDEVRVSDGRHRFAWVRDHGAVALPATASTDQADQIARLFGTAIEVIEVILA